MRKASRLLVLAALAPLPRGIVAQDVTALQDACLDGSAAACYEIGAMFRTGQSVERDPMRATVYLERACSQGAMQGCATLALMYRRGEGVAPDTRRAVDLFEQACEGDELSACTNLGMLYVEGVGVPQDFERAIEYYERACGGEDLLGCANLGLLYRRGLGVEEDPDRGLELLGLACAGGLAEACSTATDGHWQLATYEMDADPPLATIQARAAAGTTAILRISCTPEGADVSVDWSTDFEDDDLPLTTVLGSEETAPEDWAFDVERDRHSYRGDARALIATLSRSEDQRLFLSVPEASASFVLSGVTTAAAPLARVCGW
ncbi:MAG TPA: tetratricopeptide repeat protein [Longimicrobiales bacterium]|nr:tetratricopeptide repeat protein [Longimicrobiales bacterium]